MKHFFKTISLPFLFVLASSFTLLAQEGKKLIAVVNKADWCHVCQANGEKIMNEVIPVFKESNVQFIVNDLTDESTKEESKKVLKDKKVFETVKKTISTGIILILDGSSGILLEKISITESADKLIETIKKQSSITEKM